MTKHLESISPLECGPPLERRQQQSERPDVSCPVMNRMEAIAPLGQPSAKPFVWCNAMCHPEAIAPAIAPLGQPSARPLVWCDTMSHFETIAPLDQSSAKALETISPLELGPPLERRKKQSEMPHMSHPVMSSSCASCHVMSRPEAIAPLELASLHRSPEHCTPLRLELQLWQSTR